MAEMVQLSQSEIKRLQNQIKMQEIEVAKLNKELESFKSLQRKSKRGQNYCPSMIVTDNYVTNSQPHLQVNLTPSA